MNDTTFKLRVPTSELADWREKAGKRGLSAWIRGRCNAAETVQGLQNHKRATDGGEVSSGSIRADGGLGEREACAHHKQKGSLCYKCDPKFGNPVIDGPS